MMFVRYNKRKTFSLQNILVGGLFFLAPYEFKRRKTQYLLLFFSYDFAMWGPIYTILDQKITKPFEFVNFINEFI